jgi:carbon-monoxide dehydrogenase small subunit
MTALHLLETHPLADRQTIRRELSSNICRCTGYQSIVDAIEAVARTAYAGTARLIDGEVQGPAPA